MKRGKIYIFILLISIIALIIILALTSSPPSNKNMEMEVLAQNLDTPWAMDFLPDGSMIFTERGGKISILQNKTVKVVGNIAVTEVQESGLMGVAVHPNFTQNRYIYLYYTQNGVNKISRFALNDKLENEQVILDNIPSSPIHNGGRLKFGPDGKLYATTGDAGNSNIAQDTNSTGGKILRLNPDGSIPSDNPFTNYVYSYGHRDPQGLAWNSVNGTLYASEHGSVMNDEINIITKGGNYGWPTVEGNKSESGLISPLRVYTEFTLAPSGIAFHRNHLYVAGLRGSQIRKLNLSDDGKSVIGENALFTDLGRIRDVIVHQGYLYFCTSNKDGRGNPQAGDDRIIRIKLS